MAEVDRELDRETFGDFLRVSPVERLFSFSVCSRCPLRVSRRERDESEAFVSRFLRVPVLREERLSGVFVSRETIVTQQRCLH